jgi:hypothetical protein
MKTTIAILFGSLMISMPLIAEPKLVEGDIDGVVLIRDERDGELVEDFIIASQIVSVRVIGPEVPGALEASVYIYTASEQRVSERFSFRLNYPNREEAAKAGTRILSIIRKAEQNAAGQSATRLESK